MFVRTPAAVVLIDPATFAPREVIGRATLLAGLDLHAALAELGVTPEEATHVLISHCGVSEFVIERSTFHLKR